MKTYLKEVSFTISGENLAQLPDGELPEWLPETPAAEPEPARPVRRGRKMKPVLAALVLCGAAALAVREYHSAETVSTPEEAQIQAETPAVPEEVVTHTAVFLADDEVVETVTYAAGAEAVEEPAVPEKTGWLGAWEDYTLDGDVTIRAVYTFAPWEGVVCSEELRIHVKPDADTKSVRVLEVGESVSILEETVVDTEVWCRVEDGWVQRISIADASQGGAVAEALDISLSGDWMISAETAAELGAALRSVTDRGYDAAFLLVDLASGKSIACNTEQVFYCASTIKAPYVCAVLSQYPEAASAYAGTIQDVLVNSSNGGYTTLRNRYGKACFADWCAEAGVELEFNKKWPGITAEQLCRLWMQSHVFFTTTEVGAEAAGWFENPAASPIHEVLGETYKTQSKAGWIAGSNAYYSASSDGGIVHADSGTYAVAILSNVPSDLTAIEPLVAALDRAHEEMN